ncbi:efflux RND transporter permease subunit [Photobacterium sp. OFAV2-7]|uniref:efflux RND transporter permease subunit n=1 Tax=Photobacterium sp. OFAV2-7 TaxID=2917748 RepID=UPI001EF68590|nr:efflux RND transporter permease subunit [Photobacterium sp. OFAV2-7]MCG7587618.1 efflux RND transporter permease subunit [Photobacterium sp. OFAV2-7]
MINPAAVSIKNKLLMVLFIIGMLFSGWQSYQTMPRFEDPEFVIRSAVILTEYPGASPMEVANEVTEPLESAIQEMAEVEEIVSTSSDGLSRIEVLVKYSAAPTKDDLQLVWNKLRNRINDSQYLLPAEAYNSFINDDFGDVYGIYYLLTGEGYSNRQLEDYAKKLRTRILAVDGVAKVTLTGVQQEAVYIELSKQRANSLGVSLSQIFESLKQQNSVVFAGNANLDTMRSTIQLPNAVTSVESLEYLHVATDSDGTIVYLKDIATISREVQRPLVHEVRYNGQPAIGFGIANVAGANVVEVGELVDAELRASINLQPVGMELHEFYHQAKVTQVAVDEFVANVFLALAIVLVTLMIFMGIKPAVIIGATLILTIAATLYTMQLSGIPMHRISLGALIIALGMLVDNAIVVTESVFSNKRSINKFELLQTVTKRSIWPLLGGTLVGILAFAPISLSEGDSAEYTRHLFFVVLISLMYSWVFAITFVPFLCDLMIKGKTISATQSEPAFIQKYKSFMQVILRHRIKTVGITVLMFFSSIYAAQYMKPGFFPTSTTPQFVVDYWLPQGTDIDITRHDLLEIEKELMEIDGVSGVQTLVGAGAMRYMLIYQGESENTSYGQFLVKMDNLDDVKPTIQRVQKLIDDNYADALTKVWQFELGPGGGSKIEAEFSGPDPVVLRRLAEQAKLIMVEDGKAMSIKDNWRQPVRVIQPYYDPTLANRLGISKQDIASALLVNYTGQQIGTYRENDRLLPIVARAPLAERDTVENIKLLQVTSSTTGEQVPLTQVVRSFETVWRDGLLKRENRVWRIKAQSDPVSGELAGTLFARLKPKIEAIELPPGYSLEWGGEHGDSTKANKNLADAIPFSLLSMILVTVVLFNKVRQPLLIWSIVPLATIGVVYGLVLTGTPFEFMAILGLLSLSGLLIKNAIVLVDQMDLEIAEGKPRYTAVLDSAASRVKPVLMGALTTILGVLPLFYDAFFLSMAVVLVFGLTVATLLTLVVVPSLYMIFFGIKEAETM